MFCFKKYLSMQLWKSKITNQFGTQYIFNIFKKNLSIDLFSLFQLQAVCDHKKQLLDIYVGYPGSVHDSRVFRNSPLSNSLADRCGRYFLLADSGYPLKPNVLTPYKDRGNLTPRQRNFNNKLCKNRYVIEHCFGILKQKFRQLYHLKLRKIAFMVHFIRAACVLHNICINDNVNLPVENIQNIGDNDGQNDIEAIDDNNDIDARMIRYNIANTLQM